MSDAAGRPPAALPARLAELLAAHAADPDADAAGPAAAARRAEVVALHAREPLAAPIAQLAAARILVGSPHVADVQLAQTLALRAMAQHAAARPWAARAFDRLRVLAGRAQKYGTE